MAVFKDVSGLEAGRIRKKLHSIFKDRDLPISAQMNFKVVDLLDIGLNLTNGKYGPYRKPNGTPVYINQRSNCPPLIINNLPAAISKRINGISCDKEVFQCSAPLHNNALQSSGYAVKIDYNKETTSPGTRKSRNRARKIIWFNPPYSQNVSTNAGHRFLKLINRHFHPGSNLYKIFKKNNIKVSQSCIKNVGSIIKNHNRSLIDSNKNEPSSPCNCRNKQNCPLKKPASYTRLR